MTIKHMLKNKNKKQKNISELRQDLVSGTWAVVATGRAKRPEMFKKQKREVFQESTKDCPFCHLGDPKEGKNPLIYFRENGDWSLRVIPNKFPAFKQERGLNKREQGPFHIMDGIGFHEVIITKDHDRQMANFEVAEVAEVLDCYQERYLDLMNRRFVNYISIFHNHGKEAGASISHPHSQLIALPVIDPDISRSLQGSCNYYRANKKCVHCVMIEWERKSKKRIIFENDDFVVFCPFVSRAAFEIRVYPKAHKSYFERMNEREKFQAAEALRAGLNKLYNALDDPSYNFFIHTAPCDGKSYDHYHWHLEILPKTSIWAGFELGTGIEISTIEPEKAAMFLRKQ
jgi:UDPglucose--hexose-1-phosphate uridylyltransferase